MTKVQLESGLAAGGRQWNRFLCKRFGHNVRTCINYNWTHDRQRADGTIITDTWERWEKRCEGRQFCAWKEHGEWKTSDYERSMGR